MAEAQVETWIDADVVRIAWQGSMSSALPHLWLRDNCACSDCRITQTGEKKFMICSVPANLVPQSAEIVADQLHIIWPGGHRSVYDGSSLRSLHRSRSDVSSWPSEYSPNRCDYRSFLDDDSVAMRAIERFAIDGAMILANAPTTPGTLENLAPRLGPVREVLFDRIHDVAVDPSGYNVAHTPLALPPHNDFASYSWPPSVQALHMLVNEVPGGDSIIVDGWAVLGALRDAHPDYFDVLCRVAVPFREFDEETETFAVEPIVRCASDGSIAGLRFSNQLMQAIDPGNPEAGHFYLAYHELCARITHPDAQVSFRLDGGEVLIVAAHRVLHGRTAFEPVGSRHLQDAYFELDNVTNHLAVLRRKAEASNGR